MTYLRASVFIVFCETSPGSEENYQKLKKIIIVVTYVGQTCACQLETLFEGESEENDPPEVARSVAKIVTCVE